MTIPDLKKFLKASRVKWRSSDRKKDFVNYYEAFVKHQEIAQPKETRPQRPHQSDHLGNDIHSNGREDRCSPSPEINVPVTRSKTAEGKQKDNNPTPKANYHNPLESVTEPADPLVLSPTIGAVGSPIREDTQSELGTVIPNSNIPRPPTSIDYVTPLVTQRIGKSSAGIGATVSQLEFNQFAARVNEPLFQDNQHSALSEGLLDVAKSLLQAMNTTASGVASLSSSLQTTPTSMFHNHPAAATSSAQGPSKVRAGEPMDLDDTTPSTTNHKADQMDSDDAIPTTARRKANHTTASRKSPRIPRSGPIPVSFPIIHSKSAISLDCMSFFCTPAEDLPPPATVQERRRWVVTLDN